MALCESEKPLNSTERSYNLHQNLGVFTKFFLQRCLINIGLNVSNMLKVDSCKERNYKTNQKKVCILLHQK